MGCMSEHHAELSEADNGFATSKEAYERLRSLLNAKLASHRNDQDWRAIAEAEGACSTADLLEYLARVRA